MLLKEFLFNSNNEAQITAHDYELLKSHPQKLICIMLSEKHSKKVLEIFEKSTIYISKPKNSVSKALKIALSELPMRELLQKYENPQSTSTFLRKILKKKLVSYDNVGYFYREEFWLLASDARYYLENNQEYYEILKNNFEESSQPFSNLINMDLLRTNEKAISEPETINKCRNILCSYTKRNPDIGYCQGLNFIAWEICRRRFTEEEAFWFFTILLENILPIDYYSSMIGVLVDQRIFNDLIDEHLPKIAQKFKELSFDTSLFSIQWFVCIFSKNLQGVLLDIVFDNLVIQGSSILFKIGLVLLKFLENEIVKAKDFPSLLFLIESKSKEWRDELYFQQKINEIYLSKKVLELCRNFYRNSIEENQFNLMKDSSITRKFRNLNSEHQKKIKESKYSCKVNSLVCKTLIEYNQTFKTNYYSFIFRPNPQMNFFIQDYFDLDSKQTQKNLIIEMLNDQNLFEHIKRNTLLIGRHHHICKEEIDCCPSPFSPFSPLTPDFSKIYSFNDKFNEYNQQETNQNFLKGYLKKSVIETRKSIGTSNFQKRKSQESKKIKEKSFFAKKSLESPQNPKSKRILTHCKTLDLDNEVRNNGRPPSIESKSGNLFLKLNFDSSDNESPIHKNLNSAIVYSTSHKLIDTKEKIIPKKFNFKKKKTGSFSNIEKNEENLNVTFMDDENESVDDNNDPLKIEPRTSLFLLQAKGVYNNINDVVVDKYINVIEKSDCINFTHEFFIERSKIL